ncbi:MAG: ribonuclease E/G [Lachnospiraceae bacterium]|nr:ribonuclease E/G [Lachnospiraceae bacterium]
MSKIIVSKIKDRIFTCLFEDFTLKRINVSEENKHNILDNIYIGKVKNIVNNISAAFVEIENQTMCYLDIKNITDVVFLNYKKDSTIKVGDEILVQVTKEAQQKKAPVVSTNICIKGNNIILTHGKNYVGISNKIKDATTRKNITDCVEPFLTASYGFVVRTDAANMELNDLEHEIKNLINEYNDILNKAKHSTCFSCIKKNPPEYVVDIKDMLRKRVEEIVIEDDNLFAVVYDTIGPEFKKNNINLRHYNDLMLSLNKLYSIEINIRDLLKNKVWLKSGGNIVIQQTEALTAIDVNTSKAINLKGNNEKTFLKVNLEAAKEIANQLSLRNIGGIIIVDFIDMKNKDNKEMLLNTFDNYLSQDYVKACVVDITKLNLVEVTRQKIKQPIDRHIYEGLL